MSTNEQFGVEVQKGHQRLVQRTMNGKLFNYLVGRQTTSHTAQRLEQSYFKYHCSMVAPLTTEINGKRNLKNRKSVPKWRATLE